MTPNGWLQILIFFLLVGAVTVPLGAYMFRVFERRRTWLDPLLRPLERTIYRLCGIDEQTEQSWQEYAASVLLFSLCAMLWAYGLQRLQGMLPLNPEHLAGVRPDTAFNTAASFTTNTNWQAYSGETTMSYLTQMAGLAFHNFVSAAAGLAVCIAVIRGVARHTTNVLGNFWVDLLRGILWVLLPVSAVLALFLVSQGVIQTLSGYIDVQTMEGVRQRLPMGPVASQEAIKLLGTNGGGFFNANSAHPFENPTPLTNLVQMLAIIAIPAALTSTFGQMVGDRRQGWALFTTMAGLLVVGITVTYWAEAAGNPNVQALGMVGSNWEGKELRFGISTASLFATLTTATSCGAVNSFLDSFMPLGSLVPLVNMHLGEVVFGGVGSGLYGMLIMVLLAVFIAGLMVGRTPEYLGKKIGAREVKPALLAILIPALCILALTAVAAVSDSGVQSLLNPGAHGLTEMLYAYTSGAQNNGSAFAGLSANTGFFNLTLGVAMLAGRFLPLIAVLAIAGSLGKQRRATATAGSFPTHTPLFAGLLAGVILIIGGLTYFPSYALGPVLDHLTVRQASATATP